MRGETHRGFPTFVKGMSDMLRISHYILETKVLGPYVRSAIWVNGCCFNCRGCIAEEMNSQTPTRIDIDKLIGIFSGIKTCEGITISGGEPFLQAGTLFKMIKGIKKKRDYGVIVYTGFTLDELRSKSDTEIDRFLSEIDILIDGRYQDNLDDGKPFRGSSNQRIFLLTDRYKQVYNEYYYGHGKRDIEIRVEQDKVYMIGVPSQYGLQTWKDLKKRAEGNVK